MVILAIVIMKNIDVVQLYRVIFFTGITSHLLL